MSIKKDGTGVGINVCENIEQPEVLGKITGIFEIFILNKMT